jgi:pSer/pThr/pTyr-binding forkhead associated (FHA) protein
MPAEEPAGPSEVHCLEIKGGEVADELIVVETSGVKIGRAPPADIVLSHRSVSREHCIVGLANDELLVTDLNSTNGTYIDDVRIHRATILPVGSVLRLGQISLRHAIMTKAEAGPRERTWFQPARVAASS